MEFSLKRTANVIAILLLAAAITQAVYTALYLGAPDISRAFLWQIEAVLFVVMTAFAGSALAARARARRFSGRSRRRSPITLHGPPSRLRAY